VGDSPERVIASQGAVFLSYASQDVEAAKRICAALRAGGIEVFLDQSELRGGDVWDQKIRHEISSCALFIPLISQHTQNRLEGYFRHEWNLAIERTHHMAHQKPFLVPVVVDDTRDREAFVPDAFRAVQWTHLPGGAAQSEFVETIERLLSDEYSALHPGAGATAGPRKTFPAISRRGSAWLALAAVLAVAALVYVIAEKQRSPELAMAATFSPPPHSIAVLPFVNMSGDKEQEYFSDGLTEELLNALSQVNHLQVAARTSAFSFKGKEADIGTIARRLNVGAVLEGSVRRSGNTVRVTTQLINAETGFHLWSHTYDRNLGDVLKLESEIAGAVAGALKVNLLEDEATRIELGGTRSAAAFDAYLRGRRIYLAAHDAGDYQTAISAYTEAIDLDAGYALAFAYRSLALTAYAGESGSTVRGSFNKAREDARKAIELAPALAEGHFALARYFDIGELNFAATNQAYEKALALAPASSQVLRVYGPFAVLMGRTEAGIAAARRAVVLDPLNHSSHRNLGQVLYFARQPREALKAVQAALALDPDDPADYADRGFNYYALGDLERARSSCESKVDDWGNQQCLAVTYEKLGRHADAEGMLARLKATLGEAAAYQYATIYAQWGRIPDALAALEKSKRLRDPGLEYLKADPLMDPLRNEPRFQVVLRELKFPD
jgi:TolB-like protein/Tfp pilus assembly protein PilF